LQKVKWEVCVLQSKSYVEEWPTHYTARSQLHETKWNGSVVDTRAYDLGGRLDTSTFGNGVVNDYDWRDDNLLAGITFTHPGGVDADKQVGDYTYAWDANKNKTGETITGILDDFSFTTIDGSDDGYDDEDRVTRFKRSGTTNPQTWDLSLVGDWDSWSNFGTAQDRTHGPAHEVLTVGSSPNDEVTHDAKWNITFLPTNLLTPARTLFWDFDNQLTGVDTTGDATPDVTYQYDVLHRRVTRVQGSADAVYVHAGNQVVAEYRLGGLPSVPQQRYVWGDYIDEPILKQSSGLGGSTLYYHHNQQYSTVALTNTSGEVVERYAYTAYGELLVTDHAGTPRSLTAHANRYTYTGREWDDAVKLYYFRARWYEPILGRYLSNDPLGFSDGMCKYCAVFVPRFTDAMGLDVVPIDFDPPVVEDFSPGPDLPAPIPVYPYPEDQEWTGFGVWRLPVGSELATCYEACKRAHLAYTYDDSNARQACRLKCRNCLKTITEWMREDDLRDRAWLGDLPDCPCDICYRYSYRYFDFWQARWCYASAAEYRHPPLGWGWDQATITVYRPFVRWWKGISDTHPGADYCIRSEAATGQPTQQCCYLGCKLITSGAGAGSPDLNNPSHPEADVEPWFCALFLDGHVLGEVHHAHGGQFFTEYVNRRPANNDLGCPPLKVP